VQNIIGHNNKIVKTVFFVKLLIEANSSQISKLKISNSKLN